MIDRPFDPEAPVLPPATPSNPGTRSAPTHRPVFPHHAEAIPPGVITSGAYDLRFAWTWADLEAVQALRYRVFHEELGEGQGMNVSSQRDEEPRDPWFHHLMIVERATDEVVGTYRMQTVEMAASRFGFYSASLFELGGVPAAVLRRGIELGRACVTPVHRNGRVLRLLWKGIARYAQWHGAQYLFGCCSLPGVDGPQASASWAALHALGALHPDVFIRPHPDARALADDGRTIPAAGEPVRLPALFDAYLELGARVCSPPAFDFEFGTTDYLILLEIEHMQERARRIFFGS